MVKFIWLARIGFTAFTLLSLPSSIVSAKPPPLGKLVTHKEMERQRLLNLPYTPLTTRPDLMEALPKYAAALNEIRMELGAPTMEISPDKVRILNGQQFKLVDKDSNVAGIYADDAGLVFLNSDRLTGGRHDSYVLAHETTHYFFPIAVDVNTILLEGMVDRVARHVFQEVLWQSYPEERLQRAQYGRTPRGPNRFAPNEYYLDEKGNPHVFAYWAESRAMTLLDQVNPEFTSRFLKFAAGIDATPANQIISAELGIEWLPFLSSESQTRPAEIILMAEMAARATNCGGWFRRLRRKLLGF